MHEEAPLFRPDHVPRRRLQRASLIINIMFLLVFACFCLPRVVPTWHEEYYPGIDIEQRAWTWAGINVLWVAFALSYALFRFDDLALVAAANVLCSIFWTYMEIVIFAQCLRGQLTLESFLSEGGIQLIPLFFACFASVKGPEMPSISDDVRWGWREVVLIVVGIEFLLVFLYCWPVGLARITSSTKYREDVAWQWTSSSVLAFVVTVTWAACRRDGVYADRTKKAACNWCAIVCGVDLILMAFTWTALGLTGHSIVTEIVLLLNVCLVLSSSKSTQ